MTEAYYLVSQPRSSLEQSLSGVLIHDQATSLRRDRTHRGGLGERRPVHARRLWRDSGRSAVRLGLQGGWTECGGGAGLDWRAGIMIRRGGSLPRGATLLTRLRRERETARERASERVLQHLSHSRHDTHTWTPTRTHRRTVKGTRRLSEDMHTLRGRCSDACGRSHVDKNHM